MRLLLDQRLLIPDQSYRATSRRAARDGRTRRPSTPVPARGAGTAPSAAPAPASSWRRRPDRTCRDRCGGRRAAGACRSTGDDPRSGRRPTRAPARRSSGTDSIPAGLLRTMSASSSKRMCEVAVGVGAGPRVALPGRSIHNADDVAGDETRARRPPAAASTSLRKILPRSSAVGDLAARAEPLGRGEKLVEPGTRIAVGRRPTGD